jgi:hypothetical protein
MIPEQVLKIFSGSMVSHLGSRDARLQTSEVMVWGVKIDSGKKQLTAFIPKQVAERTINNLQSTKKVAITVGEPLSHELYQFKGDYISHADATAEEEILQDQYINTFYEKYLKLFGYPPEIVDSVNYKPSVAVTLQFEEIYVQTPGPNAGSRIF